MLQFVLNSTVLAFTPLLFAELRQGYRLSQAKGIYSLIPPIYYSSFHFLFHYPNITPICSLYPLYNPNIYPSGDILAGDLSGYGSLAQHAPEVEMGVSQNCHNKDYSILVSILGSPY